MKDKCFTMHEFLDNAPGAAEHATSCPSCNALAQLVQRYGAIRDRELTQLSALKRDVEKQRNANETIELLRGIAPDKRVMWIKNHDAASLQLAVALAVEGRSHIYTSPRKTEEWLRLAHEVLQLSAGKDREHASDEAFAIARLHTIEGSLAVMRGHIQEAHSHYLRAREMHLQLGDDYQAALVVEGLVQTFLLQGEAHEALTIGLQTLAVLREYGAQQFYVRLFKNISAAVFALGKHQRALRISQCVIQLQDVDAESRVMHLRNHALLLYALERLDEAEQLAQELLTMTTAQERTMEVARSKWLLGELATERGEYRKARALLHEATEVFVAEDDLLDAALCRAQLANIDLQQGKRAEASQALQIVCDYLRREGIHYHLEIQLRAWLQSINEQSETSLPLGKKAFAAIRQLQSPYKASAQPVHL